MFETAQMHMIDFWFAAETTLLMVGSHTTISASDPSRIAPFCGYMLRILAMFVEVHATNSFLVRRPVSTPLVQRTERRSSRPPVPLGMKGKPLSPMRFCSVLNAA